MLTPTLAPINANSSESNIIANSTFTYPTDINYASNTGNDVLASHPEIFKFDIQDGGNDLMDPDQVGTIVNSLTFAVSNASVFERIALYDGTSELAEVPAGATITFSNLNIAAADESAKSLSLRATYKTTVIDNTQFSFTISGTTTNAAGSNFVAANAGAATSSITGDNNRIEVTASQLKFVQQPPATVSTNTTITPAVTIEATDANGNRDLDFVTAVEVAASGAALTGSLVSATPASGLATFSGLTFTTAGTGVTLAASRSISNDWTINSSPFDVTTPAPVMTFKQGSNTITNGGGYTFGTALVVGSTTGTPISFTIGNTGNANLTTIAASITGDFEITASPASSVPVGSTTTTVSVRFKPTAAGVRTGSLTITSSDPSQSPYVINLTGTGTPNSASDIVATTGFTYPTNIDYRLYQAASINSLSDGLAVYGFTVRDGGGATDADDVATTVSALTFSSVSGTTNIQAAALFKGNILVSNAGAASGNTIVFTGLPTTGANAISAADGSTEDVTLVLTFKNSVTDNAQLQFTITNGNATTVSGNTSSAFKTFSLSSPVAGGENKIIVAGTTLRFVQQPPLSVASNTNISPAVTLEIVDGNNNRDLDGTVSITATGATLTGSPLTATANASGLFSFGTIKFSTTGTGVTLSALISNPSLSATSNPFDVTLGPDQFVYRSRNSGNWNNIATGSETWERSLDGISWLPVTNASDLPSDAAGAITVMNPHEVIVTANVAADELTVQSGGILTINSGVDLTLADGNGTDLLISGTVKVTGSLTLTAASEVIVNGTMRKSGTLNSTSNPIFFNAGSYYKHEPSSGFGVIPTANWNAGSTVEILTINNIGSGSAGLGLTQSFGNFIWNCSTQGTTMNLTGFLPTRIKGNFEVQNTNGRELRLSGNASYSLTIDGDLTVSSNTTLNASNGGSGSYVVSLGGNLQVLGTFKQDNGGNPVAFTFTGTNKSINISSVNTNSLINWTIASNAQLNLASDFLVATGRSLIVNGHLNTDNFTVAGAGTFTLANGATLGIGSANGITPLGTPSGNILVTTARNYNTNANYIYNGTTAQNSGNGLPNAFASLTINNPNGVTLNKNVEVSTLTLNQGKLITTTNLLTIPATGSVLSPESATSFVHGPLAYKVTAPKLLNFPIGKGANGRPIELNIQSQGTGENIYTAEQIEQAFVPNDTTMATGVKNISKIRYFNITKTGTARVTAKVQLTYATDDVVTDPAKLTIVKYSNGANPINLNAIANPTANGGTIVSDTFSTFSDFMLGSLKRGVNPLPVELLSFTAKAKENATALTWETASEKNSSHFEIERSHDARNFETIGTEKAIGNSQTLKRYAFTDQNPMSGVAYYRLKQVDLDGTIVYSKIEQVNRNTKALDIHLYPNPTAGNLTISLPETGETEVKVMNVLGQVVGLKKIVNTKTVELDLTHLPAGTYQVMIVTDKTQFLKKVIKTAR
ncbi:T9SS type A sorting domain-containing protein [Adhaeribacter terrigena]|uniref:T9SS type A sorting domain-containing protein n=1 Tax=Adhaeribacter terrigena TaxID=2793070 RepID=UPI00190C0EED|nr:T9SS type A sorting domain-containing protein [Adhaeribacter terrigena]